MNFLQLRFQADEFGAVASLTLEGFQTLRGFLDTELSENHFLKTPCIFLGNWANATPRRCNLKYRCELKRMTC